MNEHIRSNLEKGNFQGISRITFFLELYQPTKCRDRTGNVPNEAKFRTLPFEEFGFKLRQCGKQLLIPTKAFCFKTDFEILLKHSDVSSTHSTIGSDDFMSLT